MEYEMKKFFSLTILTLSLLILNLPLCSANDPAIVQEIENRLNKAKEEMPFLETEETLNEWLSAQDRTGEEVVEALVKSKKVLNEMLEPIIKHAVETRQEPREVYASHIEELENKLVVFVHRNLWYIDRSVATMIKDDANKKLKESIERALEQLFSEGIPATDNTPFYSWVVMRIRELSALKDAFLKEQLFRVFIYFFVNPIKLLEKDYVGPLFPGEEVFGAFTRDHGIVEEREELKGRLESLLRYVPRTDCDKSVCFLEFVGQKKLDAFGLMSLTEEEIREVTWFRNRYKKKIAEIKLNFTSISHFWNRRNFLERVYERIREGYKPDKGNFKPTLRRLLFIKKNVYKGNEEAFLKKYGKDLAFNLELKERKIWSRLDYGHRPWLDEPWLPPGRKRPRKEAQQPSPDGPPQLPRRKRPRKEAQQDFVESLESPAQPRPMTTSPVFKAGAIVLAVAAMAVVETAYECCF